MITRRNFVKGISATFAASMVLPLRLSAFPSGKIIGIQLYTLRDQIKDDFEGTLQKIADIGYNAVEAAGYADGKFYGFTPVEYKKITEDKGLIPQSSHTGINLQNVDRVIEDTLEAGMSYIVLPYISQDKRKTLDDYKKLAEEFNQIGERCKKSGLQFAYHNHAFEFEKTDEIIPYDILLNRTEAEFVTMQLDLYWMIYGGCEPLDYFKRYPGRFELWHVKDMDYTDKRESTEIGQGRIDFEKIFAAKDKAGMKYYYLEQESFKIPPFESIAISFNYLNNLQY
ncbi:MAG: sugar phosphate isomerase/epimerase [Bacteroidetes bacterium]|nr:sugar phosphate isomerase/epimerase [Bacteroidota bacterium]MBL7103283.1 sugar phosphate isomerase/epimerase [Bacteroidales bacterium]